ncbi:MAG TPA: type II toxin-antitoxin system HicB family antitoxin [Pyrinomonadaceae bacterium]
MSVFNYTYEAVWSPEDRAFIARVKEFPSLAAHGASRGSSLRALRSVVDAVVKDLIKSGKEIPQPFSATKTADKK